MYINDTATAEIYTLSLHDALPISAGTYPDLTGLSCRFAEIATERGVILSLIAVPSPGGDQEAFQDRKSTRLNSSHANISYAVFCLKKKSNLKLDLSFNSVSASCC